MLNTKLGWLPIDNIIRTRKLFLPHKICNGCGPEYLSTYVNYMSRVVIITTRESQEEMSLSRLSVKKNQASEHSIPAPLA